MTAMRASVILLFGLFACLFVARAVFNHLPEPSLEVKLAREIETAPQPIGPERTGMETMPLIANPLSDMKREELNETIDRPLFSPTRRAFVSPSRGVIIAPTTPSYRSKKFSYKLLGVLISKGRSIALIRDLSDGRNIRVRLGDRVQGWSIGKVGRHQISLNKRGEKSMVLKLFPE